MKPNTTDEVFDFLDAVFWSAALGTALELGLFWLLADRLSYLAADYVQDDLPSGFDLALECDAGPYDQAFFRKIRAILNRGGRLVIVDKLAPDAGVAPPGYLTWAFLGSLSDPDSSFTTAGEVTTALVQAGFQVLSERALQPEGTPRWSEGWTVIEAGT
jgi:hypothetical protein